VAKATNGSWRIQWGWTEELSVPLADRSAQLQRPAVIGRLWLHRCGSQTLSIDRTSQEQSELDFLAELKLWLDRQVDGESSDISCVLSPYLLTIYYRGETVGSWRATREGARWHGRHEEDATTVVLRDVYDAIAHTKRALFLFVRDVKNR
jgi:hypothetical protein